eukprot:1991898-Pyramimonas_sp.AAC.1
MKGYDGQICLQDCVGMKARPEVRPGQSRSPDQHGSRSETVKAMPQAAIGRLVPMDIVTEG